MSRGAIALARTGCLAPRASRLPARAWSRPRAPPSLRVSPIDLACPRTRAEASRCSSRTFSATIRDSPPGIARSTPPALPTPARFSSPLSRPVTRVIALRDVEIHAAVGDARPQCPNSARSGLRTSGRSRPVLVPMFPGIESHDAMKTTDVGASEPASASIMFRSRTSVSRVRHASSVAEDSPGGCPRTSRPLRAPPRRPRRIRGSPCRAARRKTRRDRSGRTGSAPDRGSREWRVRCRSAATRCRSGSAGCVRAPLPPLLTAKGAGSRGGSRRRLRPDSVLTNSSEATVRCLPPTFIVTSAGFKSGTAWPFMPSARKSTTTPPPCCTPGGGSARRTPAAMTEMEARRMASEAQRMDFFMRKA